MEYRINTGLIGNMFSVPGIVADNFLKLATGSQLKVLLYIIRSSGRDLSAEDISAGTGVSVQETEEAVLFWQQANVLSADAEIPASLMQPAVSAPQPAQDISRPAETQPETKTAPARMPLLAPSDIAQLVSGSPDITELFTAAESALGPLGHTMQNALITMYTHLGLKKEVILILLNYCKSIEKTNSAYIEKIAYSWADSEINSLEAAQDEVERLSLAHDYSGMVMKQFEMKRRPVPSQMVFVEQWRAAGFTPELLRLAYERTIENIDKLSFSYINKILLSWKDSGFRTVEEVEKAESEYRGKKKKNGGSTGSMDKYKEFINDF
ncbi:MAG: DnaD domain protein [Ruminococcus sp.]|nr:DnaD domain protein [Ruminococcus sp.]